tara:strand:- start:250 stop:498 length:249 start_codon:yes stop_codon:yes gene_type:complete
MATISEKELINRLMSWALNLEVGELPPTPWTFYSCLVVDNNEKFLKAIKQDIQHGPNGPRAKTGAIQADVIRIWNKIGNKNQ